MRAARSILWLALAGYPFFIRAMHSVAGHSDALAVRTAGFLLLSAACLPAAMAMLCLHQLPTQNVAQPVRRAVGREAVLGAISPALFVAIDTGLSLAGWLPLRDGVWWLLLAGVFSLRFVALREVRIASDVGTHKVHIASALVLMSFAVAHVANHAVALWSFAASDAAMKAMRRIYRVRPVEVLLLAAVLTQVATGARLVAGSRMLQRSTFLRNVQILSGAYLGVFLLDHAGYMVIVERLLRGADPLFSVSTGDGRFGMMTSANNARLMPFYAVAVAALFVHIAAAGRWLLVPVIGSNGAARFGRVTMWLGVILAVAVVLPMMQVHLGR